MNLLRETMSERHWLSLAIVSLFLSYAVVTPAHTVHHGLHDGDPQGCPVSTMTTQTNGELPDILPLPIPLPCTELLQTIEPILPETPISQPYRSRGPPRLPK